MCTYKASTEVENTRLCEFYREEDMSWCVYPQFQKVGSVAGNCTLTENVCKHKIKKK